MPPLELRSIAARTTPTLRPDQSTFDYCFSPLFPHLRDCSYIVDNWYPDNLLLPAQRDLLARYRVASVDIGRRTIDVYRGKRFLPTFAFAIPASFGTVFAFKSPPDEATLRPCTYADYYIYSGKLAPLAIASFVAFEGTWTIATTDPSLLEALRQGLPPGTELAETPRSLNFLGPP